MTPDYADDDEDEPLPAPAALRFREFRVAFGRAVAGRGSLAAALGKYARGATGGASTGPRRFGPAYRAGRAWASTVHAFQGRTVDTVIAAIEANHPNLTNQKMLYVEISRARDRAELVTDDKAALKEQLEALTGERIAALKALGDGKVKAPEAGRHLGETAESGKEPGPRTGLTPEWEKSPAPKSVDRDFGL